MDIKKIFRREWWALFFELLAALIVVLVVLIKVLPFMSWNYMWLILLLPVVFLLIIWVNKLDVPANHVYSVEWLGKFYNLSSGRWYPFPYFGRLRNIESIPSNKLFLSIMLGVRTEKEKETLGEYVYGTPSNVETIGDFVRLLLKLEIQCVDAIKLCSSHQDPYKYIVGLVEIAVRKFAGKIDNDQMDKEYYSHDWKAEVKKIEDEFKILEKLGLIIHSLVPVDVLNTPEVEEFNRKVQEADQQGRVIDKQTINKVKEEAGKGKVLTERLSNIKKERTIGLEADGILEHTINTIKKTSDVRGDVALRFITEKDKHETVRASAINGGIVYIENGAGANSNASVGAGLTWGINSANSAAAKNTNPSISKDKDKKSDKASKKVKGKVRNDDTDDEEDD